ncbi:MAG TPA: hypothetical protein VG591_07090 [Burkholderiales bacterium]|jgi:uncharacterized membrane protein YeaQ/YmgE (transglycosylase-associated protein family)|nr:hypothetical protein [Burkholderiales bacterium]
MDTILWILTGGTLGWLSYVLLRFNEARGMSISIAIGAAGGLVGGKVLAPMFTSAAAADLSVPALFFAATAAAVLLVIGNLLYVRWGV